MDHKELRSVLDSLVRASADSQRLESDFLAVVMGQQGKISRVAASTALTTGSRAAVETGLRLLAQQNKCRAIGIYSTERPSDNSSQNTEVFLEHSDGSSYLVVFRGEESNLRKPWAAEPAVTAAKPRFFLKD